MRPAIILALAAICCLAAAEPAMDEEFLGPFPDWYDLKRDFGAVGDGKADDTVALQKALDSVGTPELKRSAVWVPAGTYRITRTLVRTDVSGVFLIGEHPDSTVIRWDGPAYGGEERVPAFNSDAYKAWDGRHPAEMLWFNGRNSRFERLTFDGAGKAASGLALKWHGTGEKSGQGPSHRISLADMVFKDMAIGFDGGGKLCWLDSEVLLQRCRFERCSQFGVGLHHFNSVDYWLWNCTFTDCAVGVSNEPKPHGGVIHVYDSLFRGSTEADFTIYHAGFFGLRNNTSIGSKRFVHAKNNGPNGASFHLQGNRVIDTIETDAVLVETLGNIHLMDNLFVSRPGTVGPVVRGGVSLATAPPWDAKSTAFVDGWAPMAMSLIGNAFSVAQPVQIHGQLVELDTRIASRDELLAAAPIPAMPGVLPRHQRRVFGVASGADAAAIQAAIDAAAQVAAADPGAWPVVHLPHGRYPLKQTVTIPAGARIQLAGDGCYTWGDGPRGTVLVWADEQAPGPALRIQGPAQARLRDFGILTPEPWRRSDPKLRQEWGTLKGPPSPNLVAAIAAEGIDQPGGRVHVQECNPNGLYGVGTLVEGLDRTFVQVIACEGTGFDGDWNRKWDGQEKRDPWGPYPAIRVIGGPLAKSGKPVPGVLVQGGNTGRWDVQQGGKLVVRDCWYESNSKSFHMFLRGDGRLTLDCGYDAQYTHPSLKGAGVSYLFDGWRGRFVSLNIGGHYSADNPPTAFAGDCAGARLLFIGNAGDPGTPPPVAPAGAVILDLNRRMGSAVQANPAAIDADFVRDLLSDARTSRVQTLAPLPAGITDLRLSRVWTWNGRVGLHLKGR
jgi:hypothetical protein